MYFTSTRRKSSLCLKCISIILSPINSTFIFSFPKSLIHSDNIKPGIGYSFPVVKIWTNSPSSIKPCVQKTRKIWIVFPSIVYAVLGPSKLTPKISGSIVVILFASKNILQVWNTHTTKIHYDLTIYSPVLSTGFIGNHNGVTKFNRKVLIY